MTVMETATQSGDNRQWTPEEIAGSLDLAETAFRRVGPLIVGRAGQASYTDKPDGSPVTETDVAVEDILKAEIGRSGVAVYGEEGGYGDDLSGTFWLLDPIDGTRDFIENVPKFTTVGVLIQDGEAVAAAIYNPSTGDMYTAQKGKGAFKNGVRLDISALPLPEIAWCKEQFVTEISEILRPTGVECEAAPRAASYAFGQVAEGQAAARFNLHSGGYTHDYAPGALLIREAGGVIIPVLDDEYTYQTRSFVACHPELEATIRPHIARLRELEALRGA